jgi:hypothetical protein
MTEKRTDFSVLSCPVLSSVRDPGQDRTGTDKIVRDRGQDRGQDRREKTRTGKHCYIYILHTYISVEFRPTMLGEGHWIPQTREFRICA